MNKVSRRTDRCVVQISTLSLLPRLEYADSPASSTKEAPAKKKRGEGVRKGRLRGGRKASEPKVPPMKIKMIGRSGESDSPIFLAESLGENVSLLTCARPITVDRPCIPTQWETEGSGSERGSIRDKRSRLKGQHAPCWSGNTLLDSLASSLPHQFPGFLVWDVGWNAFKWLPLLTVWFVDMICWKTCLG